VARKLGVRQKVVFGFAEAFISEIKKELQRSGKVIITNLGTFEIKPPIPERIIKGKKVKTKKKQRVTFTASKNIFRDG